MGSLPLNGSLHAMDRAAHGSRPPCPKQLRAPWPFALVEPGIVSAHGSSVPSVYQPLQTSVTTHSPVMLLLQRSFCSPLCALIHEETGTMRTAARTTP